MTTDRRDGYDMEPRLKLIRKKYNDFKTFDFAGLVDLNADKIPNCFCNLKANRNAQKLAGISMHRKI
jgi:hypothetical protein